MSLPEIAKRWGPYLALVLFVIAKIPHLSYAFYWDESWVYAPASYSMYAHGPSLLPSSIPVDLSRGHPLLFPALVATWMNIFGNSHFAMHCFALFIAVLLAIAVYETMLKMFGQSAAFISLALLLINKSFFTESALVLNDIMIALLALLAVYSYVKEKHLLTALLLALLFFTKESGMVVCAVLFGHVLLSVVTRKIPVKDALPATLSLVIPILLILSFFVLQKNTFGWYLNPSHTSIIDLGLENTSYHIQRCLAVLFYDDQVCYCWAAMALVALVAALRLRKYYYLLVPLYTILMYTMVMVFSHKDAIFYVFVALSVIALPASILRITRKYNARQALFIKLAAAFSLLYIYFCCVNFFEPRYLFPAMLFLPILLLAVILDHTISQLTSKKYPALIIAAVIAAASLATGNGQLLMYDRITVQQQLVDYLENHHGYERHICCPPFLERVHLLNPNTGFLRSDKVFRNVTIEPNKRTELLVLDNIEPDAASENTKRDSTFSHLLRFSKGNAWVDLYERK